MFWVGTPFDTMNKVIEARCMSQTWKLLAAVLQNMYNFLLSRLSHKCHPYLLSVSNHPSHKDLNLVGQP